MSDYQRFVTYINLYEGNSKIKSVGFAKIESRAKACDMEIHMRGTGYTGIACPVYLFVRENDRMLGISIGKIPLTGGSGDSRFSLDGENIGGSGYGLGRICGFLILVTENIMFASQWDEKEIRRERFTLPEEVSRSEKLGPEDELQHIEEVEPEREQPKAEEPEPGIVKEEPKEKKPGPRGTRKLVKAEEPAPEPEAIWEQPEWEEPELEPEELEAERELQAEDGIGLTNEQLIFGESIQATEAAAQPTEQPWAMKWQFMLENYPVMTPFEGEDEVLCIRMELKDLRLLPKRYWYLGNNSFLLHGFFNYRYIILGAMQEKRQKRWFLGVPGVFQSQEKVMAAIFGFPEYKSEKISEQKTGQFGYWYRFLE